MVTAERIETEMLSGLAGITGRNEVTGAIRIGAPDGLGSAYLAPLLGRFHATYPNLHIQLVPIPRNFSLSGREADIAIMVGRPAKGRLRVRKLVDYTLGYYATQGYLDRMGHPATPADLGGHTCIGYVEDLIYTPQLNYEREMLRGWQPDIEIATAIGQFAAVRAGVGVGVCHDFMATGTPGLVQLFPDLTATRSYWMVWHENLRNARRVQAVADLLGQCVAEDREIFAPAGRCKTDAR